MEQVDQTGAGKTLARLLNWWNRIHPEEGAHVDAELSQIVSRVYAQEAAQLERFQRNKNVIAYEHLRKKAAELIGIQDRVMDQLRGLLRHLGGQAPAIVPSGSENGFGLTYSKDLHEAHDQYNDYVRLAAQSEDPELHGKFRSLAHEKELQILLLSEIVPKIHT